MAYRTAYKINLTEYMVKNSREFRTTFVATVTINIIFGITATILNSITVIAMAKNVRLRTPCNALLFCLSLSDLGVGLICQTLYVFWKLDWLLNPSTQNYGLVYELLNALSTYFAAVSFLTVSEVSMERYLCLRYHLRYEAMSTVGRVLTASMFPWLFCALLIGINVISNGFFFYCSIIVIPMCIGQTVACYLKIFMVVRRHHNQITSQFFATKKKTSQTTNSLECRDPSQSSEIVDEPTNQEVSIDTTTLERMTRFRKTCKSMLFLFLFLLLCYIPFFFVQVYGYMKMTPAISIARNLSSTLVYMNSSINPVLYCYKISAIRNAIKELLLRRRNTQNCQN